MSDYDAGRARGYQDALGGGAGGGGLILIVLIVGVARWLWGGLQYIVSQVMHHADLEPPFNAIFGFYYVIIVWPAYGAAKTVAFFHNLLPWPNLNAVMAIVAVSTLTVAYVTGLLLPIGWAVVSNANQSRPIALFIKRCFVGTLFLLLPLAGGIVWVLVSRTVAWLFSPGHVPSPNW